MKRSTIAAALLLASTALTTLPANATIVIDDHLSGTGDNVIFNALSTNLVVGSFNGQHTGLVEFSCLGGCGGFTGAQNGNDLKIANTNDLKVQVFDLQGNVLPTATDVFSLKGTGTGTAFVIANETDGSQQLFTFNLGTLSLSAQSGFTLSAIDGETINSFRVFTTGTITDFEHYRIDVAAVPAPLVGAGLPGLLLAALGLFGLNRRRRNAVG